MCNTSRERTSYKIFICKKIRFLKTFILYVRYYTLLETYVPYDKTCITIFIWYATFIFKVSMPCMVHDNVTPYSIMQTLLLGCWCYVIKTIESNNTVNNMHHILFFKMSTAEVTRFRFCILVYMGDTKVHLGKVICYVLKVKAAYGHCYNI